MHARSLPTPPYFESRNLMITENNSSKVSESRNNHSAGLNPLEHIYYRGVGHIISSL
jgi:hypothetical protein